MKRPSMDHRGFSLIELMTVVSIVSLLAAAAIPGYTRYQRRAKRVESDLAVSNIEKAVKYYYGQKGIFPTRTGPAASTLSATWNPATLSRTSKFNAKQADWIAFEVPIDGLNRYFSYQLSGSSTSSSATFTMTVRSDLNGDSVYCLRTRTWSLASGTWRLSSDVVSGDAEY